ncbi:ribonuclease H-like domain-containing protein [Haloglomus salinum]|jgi:hypothetical protein|uniref:ribonuclease H-like domain-containing protein n=1 Tax=Haloglomus salinum TaxID=2962673 RepID=UPI0020C97141|nr:ribonuclease H-like domain-containing protein [Haloglomus salinum]
MHFDRADDGVERVATLDIETTHWKPESGEVVAVGVGVHERGTPGSEAVYDCLLREGDDEPAVIRDALDRLASYGADRLVTYNGAEFDIPFLHDRLRAHDADPVALPPVDHLDLYADRKRRADETGRKWPSLEECVAAYDATPAETHWRGEPVTNSRFGEELGPEYLDAVRAGDGTGLRAVVEHYLRSDLENNFLVYYGDVGTPFEPAFAGTRRDF